MDSDRGGTTVTGRVCRKQVYDSETAALNAARAASRVTGRLPHTYRCRTCKKANGQRAWHWANSRLRCAESPVTAAPWTELTPDGLIAVGSNQDRRRTAILLDVDEWEALIRAARAGHMDVAAIEARTRKGTV